MALAGLLMGIFLSFPMCFVPFPLVGFVCLLPLLFSFLGCFGKDVGMAIAGLILNGAAIVASCFWFYVWFMMDKT